MGKGLVAGNAHRLHEVRPLVDPQLLLGGALLAALAAGRQDTGAAPDVILQRDRGGEHLVAPGTVANEAAITRVHFLQLRSSIFNYSFSYKLGFYR